MNATNAKGTRLAVRVRGSGPALVLCNGWSTTDFFWKHMLPRWETTYTVVSWDYPGHGESEPAQSRSEMALGELADNVTAVMDVAGVEHAVLVGYSMGCQVALEAGARANERVDAIIALLGSFEHTVGTATVPWLGSPIAAGLRRMTPRANWAMHAVLHRVMRSRVGVPLGRLIGLVGPDVEAIDVQDYIDHFGGFDAPSVIAMAAEGQRHSVRPVLGRIRAPVFIVSGQGDVLAPPEISGSQLHELLPNSRLVVLPLGTHTSLFEHHEELGVLVDDFLRDVGSSGRGLQRLSA